MKDIRNSPGRKELWRRYLIIAAAVLVGIIVLSGLSHLLARMGYLEVGMTVLIVFGLAEFFLVIWLFRDFLEPSAPTESDTEITDSRFTDALIDLARKKADDTDD